MLETIKKAVVAIMQVIIKLNTLFDKERKQLVKLEEVLNMLGKPGCDFFGNTFHEEDDKDGQDHTWTNLAFFNGQIFFQECGYHQSSKNNYPLSTLSLHKVDAMLQELPEFLQEYQRYLEGMEIDHHLTLTQLTLVVQAISMVVYAK